jgi:hypothetical protein
VSVLETKTEIDVVDYAESKGVLQLKLNVIGRKGWPDRLFMYKGKIIFIEFKRAGKSPRKLQEYVHEKIRSHWFEVYVVDHYQQGVDLIDQLVHRQGVR